MTVPPLAPENLRRPPVRGDVLLRRRVPARGRRGVPRRTALEGGRAARGGAGGIRRRWLLERRAARPQDRDPRAGLRKPAIPGALHAHALRVLGRDRLLPARIVRACAGPASVDVQACDLLAASAAGRRWQTRGAGRLAGRGSLSHSATIRAIRRFTACGRHCADGQHWKSALRSEIAYLRAAAQLPLLGSPGHTVDELLNEVAQ